MKYQQKVRGLSGKGMQISPSVDDPDRSCRVACQDKFIPHRFYLVNGELGFYPFGTKCSFKSDDRYCVNGKCLKFGSDDTPVNGIFSSNLSFRSKRSLTYRNRRHYTNFAPNNFNESVSQEYLNRLLSKIDFHSERDKDVDVDQIDVNNPVFVYPNENSDNY